MANENICLSLKITGLCWTTCLSAALQYSLLIFQDSQNWQWNSPQFVLACCCSMFLMKRTFLQDPFLFFLSITATSHQSIVCSNDSDFNQEFEVKPCFILHYSSTALTDCGLCTAMFLSFKNKFWQNQYTKTSAQGWTSGQVVLGISKTKHLSSCHLPKVSIFHASHQETP